MFDFGGGTFDVTVASATPDMIDVKVTRGDMALGGLDIDLALLRHCMALFQASTGIDLAAAPHLSARNRLQNLC